MSVNQKRHKDVPITIVEDHHDALQHIYREIGSRYLPLQGVTMVHFDSHPDMLIPLHMPADQVFNKETLFETLSIENWIVPAVYAGHIDHVIWIKPPWCHQVPDGTSEFYVGKCLKTGTIRTTCSESYFLSETLYVPEHQLTNKKILKFTTLTVRPKHWKDVGMDKNDADSKSGRTGRQSAGVDDCNKARAANAVSSSNCATGAASINSNRIIKTENKAKNKTDSVENQYDRHLGIDSNSAKPDRSDSDINAQPDKSDSGNVKQDKSGDCSSAGIVEVARKRLSNTNSHVSSRGTAEVPLKKSKNDISNTSFFSSISNDSTTTPAAQDHNISDYQNDLDIECDVSSEYKGVSLLNKPDSSDGVECAAGSLPSAGSIQELSELLQEKSFILDIDLDFFSTKNPFREMYGPEQYNTLKELYKFQRPDLEECCKRRKDQLAALQQAFTILETDADATIVHSSGDQIREIVSHVRASDPSCLSFLHDAGCTCDDTELPHHVSSPTQIAQLVDSVQDLLSYLPKPTVVTIARSSLDDYCPPDQVDSIQEQVVEMLQQLFLQITVHLDYGEEEEEKDSLEPQDGVDSSTNTV